MPINDNLTHLIEQQQVQNKPMRKKEYIPLKSTNKLAKNCNKLETMQSFLELRHRGLNEILSKVKLGFT